MPTATHSNVLLLRSYIMLEKYDPDYPQYYVHYVDVSNPKGDPSLGQKMNDRVREEYADHNK